MPVELHERRTLDDEEIYKLKKGEVVLFFEFRAPKGNSYLHFKREKIEYDPDFIKLASEALKTAKKMERGPILEESNSWEEKMQGHYKNIRVAVARHHSMGYTVRGFVFIGTPK